ncbi:MAG: response regulator [Planctomycetales bacterium]|nr:response regulator [Planctomycetales bacterium]NIM10233.1 response regulator [Planctomycetales bacterium]NIN09647.1 response regulator [Planctomycetales bacterium]NIN78763.1 response regulator [Planctomycetales bacterium]NIO35944.1 response regulator [Planctomycetales bacterium]
MPARILIVDDEQSMCDLLEADLGCRGLDTTCFTSAELAFAAVQQQPFDVVLTDLKMPGVDGIQLCERIVANRPDIPVVVMTAFGSLETAVQAIRAGAYDFITKPVEMDMLALTLQRAVDHRALQEKVKLLSEAVERTQRFDQILGASPPMQKLFDQLARIADSETSVLITGESGTGKEMVARAIHNKSRRAAAPFVAVNCAALPETLIESELFGHAQGAFTDARADRKGLFLQAEGGTLFLDEIGDLPLPMQAKLLRALEERRLRPVGGDCELPFDVRLITATNRDLDTAVEEQRFREDLFFRVNVIQIELPPLRARGTDILLLAQHFIELFTARSGKQVGGMSESVAEKLLAYSWPGNVRELRNAIEHAVALARYDQLAVEDLPEKIRDYSGRCVVLAGDNPTELVPMEEVERRYILHVLDAVGGNKTLAARTLGLDRKTLYRKLSQYGVDPP